MDRSFQSTQSTNDLVPFPYGRRTLQITLYDEHAERVGQLEEGSYYKLLNVRAKMNGVDELEGQMNGDKKAQDRSKDCFQRLDPNAAKILLSGLLAWV
jgi:hypothetical protein